MIFNGTTLFSTALQGFLTIDANWEHLRVSIEAKG
jgi:hypothetical protein